MTMPERKGLVRGTPLGSQEGMVFDVQVAGFAVGRSVDTSHYGNMREDTIWIQVLRAGRKYSGRYFWTFSCFCLFTDYQGQVHEQQILVYSVITCRILLCIRHCAGCWSTAANKGTSELCLYFRSRRGHHTSTHGVVQRPAISDVKIRNDVRLFFSLIFPLLHLRLAIF